MCHEICITITLSIMLICGAICFGIMVSQRGKTDREEAHYKAKSGEAEARAMMPTTHFAQQLNEILTSELMDEAKVDLCEKLIASQPKEVQVQVAQPAYQSYPQQVYPR